jgi:hypothetical protein
MRLRMVESGFSRLALPEEVRYDRHRLSGIGWRTRALPRVQLRTPTSTAAPELDHRAMGDSLNRSVVELGALS